MKHGSFTAFCLIVSLCLLTAFPAAGDDRSLDYEAFILESFDDFESRTGQPPVKVGEQLADDIFHESTSPTKSVGAAREAVKDLKDDEYTFTWKLDASKFKSTIGEDSFPEMTLIDTWPLALYGSNPQDKEKLKALGIRSKFDRKGYNWIDVYPVKGGEPYEIPVPGRITHLDLWVWGSNLNYNLEAYFRDANGVVHTVGMGSLAFEGWKDMRIRIPSSIPQAKRILPHLAHLTFVKFRIWTTPGEEVTDAYIYFDQFKILCDTFETLYDGKELTNIDRVNEIWNSGGAAAGN